MRTLDKPPQPKNKMPNNNVANNNTPNNNTPSNAKNTQKPQKNNSKKVMKTIFQSPFHYKIQVLPLEDCQSVLGILLESSKNLRKQFGRQIKAINNEKVIKFESKVNYEKPALIVEHFVYGIKQCLDKLKKGMNLQAIIYFYDQNKHDKFQELMCHNLFHKIPYILVRQSAPLRRELGLKNLLALGITKEEMANDLRIYSSRCMIEIPWLVNTDWIALK